MPPHCPCPLIEGIGSDALHDALKYIDLELVAPHRGITFVDLASLLDHLLPKSHYAELHGTLFASSSPPPS